MPMLASQHMELVKLIRERSGGLISCASEYVNRAAEELGGGREFRLERKRAAKRLVFGGAKVDHKLTNVKALNELLPAEAREEGIVFPDKTLIGFRNVITTPAQDRERDVLETAGAIPSRRMGLLWQHLHTAMLGKMVWIVEHTPKVLRVWSAILDMNKLTHDAAILVEADAVGISHGFRALEWEDRKGPDGKTPNQPGQYGFRVTKFEIMEESIVSVPANVEAEIELWSRGKLESDEFKRHAEALKKAMPLSVPVNIDLRFNGQSLGKSQNGNGHMSLKLEHAGPKEIKPITKACGGIVLDGSWEDVQEDLCEGAWEVLQEAAVPQIESRRVWLVATLEDEAVLCAEGVNQEPELYYRVPWSMNADGKAAFEGKPEPVDISVAVKSFASRRLAMLGEKASKLPIAKLEAESAKEAGRRFLVENANDREALRQFRDVASTLLGTN